MREHYGTGMSKEDIKNLNITKSQLWSKFTDPRTGQHPDVRKRKICMDWCNYQPWRKKWKKRWFMVFDKSPCNNVEVPHYLLKKLWDEFVLRFHVNYLYITEFQGIGFGSAQLFDLTPTRTHSEDLLHLGESQSHLLNPLG